MSNTFSTNLGLIEPGINDPASTNLWGGFLNTDMVLIDSAVAGYQTISVAGSSNIILTSTQGAPDQSRNQNFQFTGVLTGSITVFFPHNMSRSFSVKNATTGAFSLSIAVNNGSGSPAGTVVVVPQGGTVPLASDGTNIVQTVDRIGLGVTAGGAVGDSRNTAMTLIAAALSTTFTADQIVVATALNGIAYSLPSYSQTINLAATGAGGMDTGSAPINGFVSLYAIYNPSGGLASILAQNASGGSPTIYGGANLPSGYTASALIGIWPTDGSGNFKKGILRGRNVSIIPVQVLSSGAATSLTSISLVSAIPLGAISVGGYADMENAATNAIIALHLAGTNIGAGGGTEPGEIDFKSVLGSGAPGVQFPFAGLLMPTPQTIYYQVANAVATININGFTF